MMIDIDNAKNVFAEIAARLSHCERFEEFVLGTTATRFSTSKNIIDFVFAREWTQDDLDKLYENYSETDLLTSTYMGDEATFKAECPWAEELSVDKRYRMLWLYSMIIQLEVTCTNDTRHKIEECFSKYGLNIELILPSASEIYSFHEPVFQHVKPDGEVAMGTTTLVINMLQY